MAARRPLRTFYIALGIIAVLGVFLIVRQLNPRGGSVTETYRTAPVTPVRPGALGNTLGSDSAPVEIVEFADFSCVHCARFSILEMPYVRDSLVSTGRLKWRFMDFPLQGNTNSPPAHLAAACAGEQGRFFEMMDGILNRQNDWVSERRPERLLRSYAQGLGLDLSRYDSCMDSRRAQPQVDADYAEGERLGVNATPTFFVNGRMWPTVLGYDQIRAIVDSLAPVAGRPAAPARR
jgi:protein-disulfide isomerase